MRKVTVLLALVSALFMTLSGLQASIISDLPDSPPYYYPELALGHVTGVPLDDVKICTQEQFNYSDSCNQSHVILTAGTTYKFVSRGAIYSYGHFGGRSVNRADVECSSQVNDSPPALVLPNPIGNQTYIRNWVRNRWGFGTTATPPAKSDLLDLFINGAEQDWQTFSGEPCDQIGHLYYVDYTPTVTGKATLLINDETVPNTMWYDNGYYGLHPQLEDKGLPENPGYLYITIYLP